MYAMYAAFLGEKSWRSLRCVSRALFAPPRWQSLVGFVGRLAVPNNFDELGALFVFLERSRIEILPHRIFAFGA